MTPIELEEACRQRYNSVGSKFWSQSEIFTLIYNGMVDFCNRTHQIERSYQISTIINIQEYDLPSTVISIKRATCDGRRLDPINFADDDLVTGLDADTTLTGTPAYFWVWGNSISLRPIPSSIQTLKIWTYNMPRTVTTVSSLDINIAYHPYLIDYVTSFMVVKDENEVLSKYYRQLWDADVLIAKDTMARNRISKGYNFVRDEDIMNGNFVGIL